MREITLSPMEMFFLTKDKQMGHMSVRKTNREDNVQDKCYSSSCFIMYTNLILHLQA